MPLRACQCTPDSEATLEEGSCQMDLRMMPPGRIRDLQVLALTWNVGQARQEKDGSDTRQSQGQSPRQREIGSIITG